MTNGTIYRIRRWDEVFENNRTREIKNMTWVAIPLEHGDGYTQMLAERDAAALYGCWIGIVQVAARCETRGTLLRRTGSPHDHDSIARLTGLHRRHLKRAWEFFVSIGWLEPCGMSQEGATISQDDATIHYTTSHNTTSDARPPSRKPWTAAQVESIYMAYPRKVGKQKAIPAIEKALKTILAEGFDENGTKPHEWLLGVVEKYSAACTKAGRDPKFIPYPATWFNQARYDDDQKEWSRG